MATAQSIKPLSSRTVEVMKPAQGMIVALSVLTLVIVQRDY